MDPNLVPTVRARIAYTLGANLFKVLLSFATGMLLARGLGPQAYGSMAFLLGVAISMRQLLDMGSSTAFFTFLSQRPRSRRFVTIYLYWLAIQLVLPLLAIGLFFPDRWLDVLWRGEQRSLVVLGFLASFLQNGVWTMVLQMGESQRSTRWVQGIGVGIAFLHLMVVTVLWFLSQLGLYLVFGAIAIEYLAASWLASTKLNFQADTPQGETIGGVVREFARYCLPLVLYSWLGFAFDFADRWLLQAYGGSIEQAYYAVSAQLAGIAVIVAASVQNVLWKEIAEAHHRSDRQRVARLYRKISRVLCTWSAMVAGFLIPWTEDILRLLLGPAYVGGALVLTIMLLYPVQQTKNHVESTMLLATGRVSVQTLTGIVFMLTSILAAYGVLAPPEATIPGMGLASVGLAIKMVVMAFIQANANAFFVARGLGVKFDWYHQVVVLGIALPAGWASHMLVSVSWGNFPHLLVSMGVAGLVYSAVVLLALYAMPWLIDSTRVSLTKLARKGIDHI